MYKFDKNHQFGLADFNQPMGLKMNPENRWVKKAEKIPWEAIEEKYAALFPGKKGMPAKPLRTALGSLLIQKQLQFSDRELVEEIRENPYFQYFIGLPGYQDTIPFVPSLLVEFRKRLTAEVLEEIDLCDDLSKQLATIRTLVEQQQYMYENKVHSVPDRIVSISQPYIRPIARGKAKAPVEFGAKLDLSIDENGIARLERLSFDAYNESDVFITAVENYKSRTGHYPERVLVDQIYRNRTNRAFCSEHGIRISGPALGRPKKDNNDYLQFAILTGCLRISKESIFTGLNNFEVVSIMDSMYDECFGFTDKEVQEILKYFNLSEHYAYVKEWYDGYHFGNANVYCPWDVINYVDLLRLEPTAKPQDFWSNSSENALVRNFIDKANVQTKYEIECLIASEYIEKEISLELTYDEIDKSIANLWSVLFTTGYLTKQGVTDDGRVRLSIPNRKIKNLFIKKIREWFSDTTANDGKTLEQFCNAFVDKDTEKIEELFGDYLWNTISIRDTAVAKDKKENFYHGILLGLLGYKASWLIKSNTELGTGYSDILVEVPNNRTGIVIELKYAENGDMDAACDEALKQIEEKSYVDKLKQDVMRNFIKYGIACFKKDCKVVVSE